VTKLHETVIHVALFSYSSSREEEEEERGEAYLALRELVA